MGKKKTKHAPLPTARPKTHRIAVSSPTVPGARQEVDYCPDAIDVMRQRRQLGKNPTENELAFRAADRIRRAHEKIYGSVGGVMDYDKVRGHGGTPVGPHDSYLQAAETMREVRIVLYPADYRAVTLCVCEGHSIEQAAQIIKRGPPARADKEEVGRNLRQGLHVLAGRWFTGRERAAAMRSWRDPENETTPSVDGVVEPGRVYVGGR